MSFSKLQSKIDRIDRELLQQSQRNTVRPTFLLTDSKGYSLERAHDSCRTEIAPIIFLPLAGSGIRSNDHCDSLLGSLSRISRNAHPLVLIWFGTCELTYKRNKFLYLRDNNEQRINLITNLYQTFKDLILLRNNRATVVFLNIPQYSIIVWNENKGHHNSKSFTGDQEQLIHHINLLNANINTLNGNICMPIFSIDLTRTTRRKNSGTQYKINFNLYRDGVHPGPLLAELWLKRICLLIHNHC